MLHDKRDFANIKRLLNLRYGDYPGFSLCDQSNHISPLGREISLPEGKRCGIRGGEGDLIYEYEHAVASLKMERTTWLACRCPNELRAFLADRL